jgi:DNA-binding NarL/FixJ family response regulator
MKQSIRVLIADEARGGQPSLRALLAGTDDMEVVSEASDEAAALAKAHIHQPDVLLFNPHLAKKGLVTVIQALQARAPHTRVLLLAAAWADCLDKTDPVGGVAGYILQSSSLEELCMAIRIIERGGKIVPFALIRSRLHCAAPSARSPWFATLTHWLSTWRHAVRLRQHFPLWPVKMRISH